MPVAAAVKVAIAPSLTVWLTGLAVITGVVPTPSSPAADVVVPREFVYLTRYWFPSSPLVGVNE